MIYYPFYATQKESLLDASACLSFDKFVPAFAENIWVLL